MEKHHQRFSLWYFVVTFGLLMLLQSLFTASHVQPLDYSEFKALLRAGHIVRVTLGTPSMQGVLHTEGIEQILPKDKVDAIMKTTGQKDTSRQHAFAVVRVDDPALVQELEAARVPYTGKVETTWVTTLLSWIVPDINGREAILRVHDGMSDEVGLLTYDQPSSPFLPGVTYAAPTAYSEHTAQTIDAEVGAIVARAHAQVRQLLGEKHAMLQRLARQLLQHEVLEGAALQALLMPECVTPETLALG